MKTKTKLPQFKKWKFFLLSIPFFLLSHTCMAQTQVGLDIVGEAAGDLSGGSVSMPDAYTVAIGAYRNDGNGTESGHVRIYQWNGNAWIQKGGNINGEDSLDLSGTSVSMPDKNTVAIGAVSNDDSGISAGHVRIYRWNDSLWVQKGIDIDGEAAYDVSGSSVSMPDSNTIGIGAYLNDGNGIDAGHVRVFSWNGNAWIQKGSDIDGEASEDDSGTSVSMPDANTLAIGAPFNDGNGSSSGHVRIYYWNGNTWTQKGNDIDGESMINLSGYSISMPDKNIVAIGAKLNDGTGTWSGHVRVYHWNGLIWNQKGTDIDGEAAGDASGVSVSMPDSNTVAIGAQKNDGNGIDAGHVRIYRWSGNNWQQSGIDIDGEAASDWSGYSVSMPDTNTVSIGALYNDGNGTDAGHVRVYSLCNGTIDTSITLSSNTLLSNDTSATYQWVNCDSAYAPVSGETNRSFTPPNTGNYSVIVSRSHCVDTSACYNVVLSGLSKHRAQEKQFTVYPNPTNGAFIIENTKGIGNIPFEIRDVTGKIVLKGNLRDKETTLDLSVYSSGIYLLRVNNQNVKIIKK